MFCDTGLEYPEIREFVRTIDNVEWLKPEINFKKVIETYGYPFISKEVSAIIGGGQGALRILEEEGLDIENRELVIEECAKRLKKQRGAWRALAQCYGALTKDNVITSCVPEDEKYHFSGIPKKYTPMVYAPFKVSDQCCKIMKKAPAHEYEERTGRKGITGQMAVESLMRQAQWIKYGCNAFEQKHPKSNPMSFWTEQDVLRYIKQHNIPICSIYGDVVYVDENGNYYDTAIDAEGAKLCTTWLERTGCMFCGYGCQFEKEDGRFVKMKDTHPKQYAYIMKPWDDGGLGYKEVIDWMNENVKLKISY